ncbi:MAG: hypothetical protein JST12_16720 [Armatimonadetes bacterium]|nr:hypothetical protein [Armatimonadota bacterium]MBS1703309.1 hypothetical protein [Armatimonadota bacterium]MBS1729074.1 hypothetical protein [Armatimonadota bacterium]
MKKTIASIAVLAIALSAFAQSKTIKVKSKGDDVRSVIATIFEQSGKQYVLETNVYQTIYMSLDDVTFEKAIDIVSKLADLDFKEKDGIWYVHTMAPTKKAPVTKTTPITAKNGTKGAVPKTIPPAAAAAETFKDPNEIDLTGRLTVQMKKVDIHEVFAEFSAQTKVDIEIDDTVPAYKLDAYFFNTSLKFALDKICKVAKLKYSFTPSKTVRISKA